MSRACGELLDFRAVAIEAIRGASQDGSPHSRGRSGGRIELAMARPDGPNGSSGIPWPEPKTDTGGEFILLSPRKLREDQWQTRKHPTPASDCPGRPEPYGTSPAAAFLDPRRDP